MARERIILGIAAVAGTVLLAACGDRSSTSSSITQTPKPEDNPAAVSYRSSAIRQLQHPTPLLVRQPTFTPVPTWTPSVKS